MQSYKIKTYFKSFSGTFLGPLSADPLSLACYSHPFYFLSFVFFFSFFFCVFSPGSFNIHIWDALLMICCNFFDFLLVSYIFLNETF